MDECDNILKRNEDGHDGCNAFNALLHGKKK